MYKQLPPQDRAALEEQMVGISVSKRVDTGAGFFTYFAINSKTMRQIHVSTIGCYVTAKINGLDDALGFILWQKNGYIDYLEGYPMRLTSSMGIDWAALKFELNSAPPISN
jgi:hypothetical protein